jgi:hypothetical protein
MLKTVLGKPYALHANLQKTRLTGPVLAGFGYQRNACSIDIRTKGLYGIVGGRNMPASQPIRKLAGSWTRLRLLWALVPVKLRILRRTSPEWPGFAQRQTKGLDGILPRQSLQW